VTASIRADTYTGILTATKEQSGVRKTLVERLNLGDPAMHGGPVLPTVFCPIHIVLSRSEETLPV
jgi:hypothetical protein